MAKQMWCMGTEGEIMDWDVFEQFIDQLQRYVRERLIPAEKEILETDIIPDSIMAEMRDMGLFGLTMPEEYGGAGMNVQQYIRSIRELSYAMPCYRSIASINIGMVCSAFKNGGTDAQKAEWLPRLAAGEVASFGLTEPGSGSDSAAMQTIAVKSGNGWVLNGTKRYITNAPFAKVALIMARTSKKLCQKMRMFRPLLFRWTRPV
jgi:acyl-CoA dehydrogenase